MKLFQKKRFDTKQFEIIDNNLKIKTKTGGKTQEWSIDIEDIGHKKFYESQSKNTGIIIGIVLLAFLMLVTYAFIRDKSSNYSVIILFYVVYGTIAFYILLKPKKSELHLTGGITTITFFSNSPSKEEVEKFVDFLIMKSKQIILDKYARVDGDLPEETQMNQLNWLRNRDLITEEEYKRLKDEYKIKKIIN